jgi:hypothetical protein
VLSNVEGGSAVVDVVVDDIEDENNEDGDDGNPTCCERCLLLLLLIIVKHVADLDLSSNATAYARTKLVGRRIIMGGFVQPEVAYGEGVK